MYSLVRMRAEYLEENQIQYEMDRRANMPNISEETGTNSERLQSRLDRDMAEERDPLFWTMEFTPEQREEEITHCETAIQQLFDRTTQCFVTPSLDEGQRIFGQMLHYHWRLNRIDMAGAAPELSRRMAENQERIHQSTTDLDALLAALRIRSTGHTFASTTTATVEEPTDHEITNNLSSTMNGDSFTNTHLAGNPTPPGPRIPPAQQRVIHEEEWSYIEMTYTAMRRPIEAWQSGAPISTQQLIDARAEIGALYNKIQRLRNQVTTAEQGLATKLHQMLVEVNLLRSTVVLELNQRGASSESIHREMARGPQSTLAGQALGGTLSRPGQFYSNIDNMNLNDTMTTYMPSSRNNAHVHMRRPNNVDQTYSVNPSTIPAGAVPTVNPPENSGARTWPPGSNVYSPGRPAYHPSVPMGSTIGSQGRPMAETDQSSGTQNNPAPGNWYHNQQSILKALSHRKYDGQTADGQKTISVDEFIGYLRAYQESGGISDEILLRYISVCMTGAAFTWWSTNIRRIHSLDQLEEELRSRFERRRMDSVSQLVNFTSRKQAKEEYLADYIDDMCRLASGLQPRMEELQVVQIIVDNANHVCKMHLAARVFDGVETLRHHANYMGAAGLIPIGTTEKKPIVKKMPMYRPRAVHATEAEVEASETPSGDPECQEEEGEISEPMVNEALIEAISRMVKNLGTTRKTNRVSQAGIGEPNKSTKPATKPNKESEQGNTTQKMEFSSEIRCFGCNAPGIFKRNCPTCNNQESKNGSAVL